MQRRLARLAKAQQPFNSLVAALEKASASAITWVESEKLRQLPRLGKTVLNINSDSQDIPHCFRLQSSVVQRSLSHQGSLSTPQRPLSLLQVASDVPRCEASMLWVVPRRTWPLSSTGGRLPPSERTPRLLISLGEPTLSAASPSPSLVLVLSTDSRSIVVEPRAEKHFQKELPLPSFALGVRVPAAGRTQAPAAAPKPSSAAPGAGKQPGAEQSSLSDDRTGWVDAENIFEVHQQQGVYQSGQASKPLRKTGGFISKPFRTAKKRSFRREFSGAKKRQPCLDQPTHSILRLRRGSRTTGAGLSMRLVKLLGRKSLGEFRQRSIGCSDRQRRLSESTAVNHIDNHCQQFTPAAVVNTAIIAADNLPVAERSSCDDRKGEEGHEAIFRKLCKVYESRQENQPLRKARGFFGKFSRYHQRPCFQSIQGSREEQCPPAAVLLKPDDLVPVGASQVIIEPGSAWYEKIVAIDQVVNYMVAMGCSLTHAMDMTGVVIPGYEDLYSYRTPPSTCLSADSPLTNPPTPW